MAKNKRETEERTDTAEKVETPAKREENARPARPCVCGNPKKPEFCTNCN